MFYEGNIEMVARINKINIKTFIQQGWIINFQRSIILQPSLTYYCDVQNLKQLNVHENSDEYYWYCLKMGSMWLEYRNKRSPICKLCLLWEETISHLLLECMITERLPESIIRDMPMNIKESGVMEQNSWLLSLERSKYQKQMNGAQTKI